MFLTFLAAERTVTQLAQVPGPLQGGGAAQAHRLGLLQGGTHHSRLLPHDDVPCLEAPGGHHVPAHLVVLLHRVGLLTVRLVFRPVRLLTLRLTVSHGEATGAPRGGRSSAYRATGSELHYCF